MDGCKKTKLLPSEFVGGSYGSWIGLLPVSWIPFLQLTRLNIAAPLALVYLPHLFGLLQAVATENRRHDSIPLVQPGFIHQAVHDSFRDVLYFASILLGGSLFYLNAAHTWDDLIDAPIDKLMARTKKRPIPRGAVSPQAAFIFTIFSAICASFFLQYLPTITAFTTIPSIILATYYPWAKKHTNFPQVYLGLCLAWGIMVGRSTVAVQVRPWNDPSAICLVLAYAFANIIYDTIYAYQDIPEDLRLGLGSTAILFGTHTKLVLSLLTVCMGISIYLCGALADMGVAYHVVGVGGSVLSVATMLYKVDLEDFRSCWFWFSTGFWATMLSITTGLSLEYACN
jgi:4-hydroxybenzoate polyprenyltransferase